MVFGQEGKLIEVEYRISKTAWLPDSLDPLMGRLAQRVSALTGLSHETAEQFQVLNYGLGGHYEPHFDDSPVL